MSDDVLLAGHTFGASVQSPALHASTFFAAQLRFLDEWKDTIFLNASTHRSFDLELHLDAQH